MMPPKTVILKGHDQGVMMIWWTPSFANKGVPSMIFNTKNLPLDFVAPVLHKGGRIRLA